jgi:hypothetical protein
MNPLKNLEKRIRGWLPKTPALPQPQRKGPANEYAKGHTKTDVPTIPNRKFQLVSGITI